VLLMQTLAQLVPILLVLSLAGMVASFGMDSTREDLFYVLRRPRLLARAFVAVNVIPPMIAVALLPLLPLSPPVKAGIALMAITPVPPLVPGQQRALGAHKAYSYGLFVAMALVSIVAVPVVFALVSELFGRHDRVSVGTIARYVATTVLIPLAFGAGLRIVSPTLAAKSARWVHRLSVALLLIAATPVFLTSWPVLGSLVGDGALFAMAVLVAAALAGGHWLGGPAPRDRATLALASATRHPGLAILLTRAKFDEDRAVIGAVMLFVLIGLFVETIYKRWFKRAMASTQHRPPSSYGSRA